MQLITTQVTGRNLYSERLDPRLFFNNWLSMSLYYIIGLLFVYHMYALHTRIPAFLVMSISFTLESFVSATQLELEVVCLVSRGVGEN